jgi:prolyl-tRNA synthetase
MDLIGVPVRITVGKMASENKVEVKLRTEIEFKLVDLGELDSVIEELLK